MFACCFIRFLSIKFEISIVRCFCQRNYFICGYKFLRCRQIFTHVNGCCNNVRIRDGNNGLRQQNNKWDKRPDNRMRKKWAGVSNAGRRTTESACSDILRRAKCSCCSPMYQCKRNSRSHNHI